jgi:hypothetical protein
MAISLRPPAVLLASIRFSHSRSGVLTLEVGLDVITAYYFMHRAIDASEGLGQVLAGFHTLQAVDYWADECLFR